MSCLEGSSKHASVFVLLIQVTKQTQHQVRLEKSSMKVKKHLHPKKEGEESGPQKSL
jgi:hypothetical protein